MSNNNEEAKLTAAECAARTGLTVRALRVYEDFGLIAPPRTPGGWRVYGLPELIRLNTITVLKSAGLSLAQIKSVTRLSDNDPSLVHVLQMQIDAWQAKQEAAIRGRALAEAAVKNLHTNDSLSIDELCNLVRSLEMSERNIEATDTASDAHVVKVSPALLDRYVGCYKVSELLVATISREGDKLYAERDNDIRHELIAQSDTEFYFAAQNAYIRFVVDSQGGVAEFVQHQQGNRVSAPRVDAAIAAAMRSKLAAKIADKTPTLGSDAALRRMIESIRIGEPIYNEMSAYLADVVRQQMPLLQATTKYLGAILSFEFLGIGHQGLDVYVVHCEHGDSHWRIGLKENGVIYNAMTLVNGPSQMNALPVSSDRTPGSEEVLCNLIEGIRMGNPNYDEMIPMFAYAIKLQLPQIQTLAQRLGKVVDIEYKNTEVMRYDVYEIQRENGSVRWRIALNEDGLIANAGAVLTDYSLAAGP